MNTGKRAAIMTNAAALMQAVYPRHTAKRVAETMGISVRTAKCWLERGVSTSRRRELAAKLIAEFDEQDVQRPSIRRLLAEWASEE